MKILSVDSSGSTASVGISEDTKLLYEIYSDIGLIHSKSLVPMIENALSFCGISAKDIDLFSVCIGPGSFTGIRIGISAIKAMAWSKSKPCAAVSSLEGLAWNGILSGRKICCVSDALGGQVYNAIFQSSGIDIKRLCDDRAISADDLCQEIKNSGESYLFVGNRADMCYNICLEAGASVSLAPEYTVLPRASGIAMAGYNAYKAGKITDAFGLTPCYIRLPQAERERLKKLKGGE